MSGPGETATGRLLVAAVGNVLRRDDGFGPAVAARLPLLPPGAEVVETGIGGVALLQELLAGCDGLVLVDAVERGAVPGTVFVLEPQVEPGGHAADVHLADPDRVLAMASALGCLPRRVAVVGCQPAEVDELGEGLSPAVERAVQVAAGKVVELLRAWASSAPPGVEQEPVGA